MGALRSVGKILPRGATAAPFVETGARTFDRGATGHLSGHQTTHAIGQNGESAIGVGMHVVFVVQTHEPLMGACNELDH